MICCGEKASSQWRLLVFVLDRRSRTSRITDGGRPLAQRAGKLGGIYQVSMIWTLQGEWQRESEREILANAAGSVGAPLGVQGVDVVACSDFCLVRFDLACRLISDEGSSNSQGVLISPDTRTQGAVAGARLLPYN